MLAGPAQVVNGRHEGNPGSLLDALGHPPEHDHMISARLAKRAAPA